MCVADYVTAIRWSEGERVREGGAGGGDWGKCVCVCV